MFAKLEITRMAQGMAAQAGARLGAIAQNVANADTPGYRAVDVPAFADIYQAAGEMRATRPQHIGTADPGRIMPSSPEALHHSAGSGAPNGNAVSLEQEMVKAAAARQDHDMALAIYRNTSAIMRAALGRQS